MKLIHLLFAICLNTVLVAQETITASITHDEITRSYILYVPDSYDTNIPVPLVLNFHGFGSNATEQMFYGDFRTIADEQGFLVVQPEGTLLNGTTTHWNVGGFTLGSTVDDVGFISALIDSLSTQYNVDLDRVYSTGMSNGGYMSFLLACQLSDRIAAIASVTGSMTPETYNDCNPSHETPIMQIHGTADNVVPYNGAIWTRSIDDVRSYWRAFNTGPSEDEETSIDDIDPNDESTATLFVNTNDNDIDVQHYQIMDGGHTWPGSSIVIGVTNQDIIASEKIWEFFDRYDINGLRNVTSTENIIADNKILFPNPVDDFINIQGDQIKSSIIYNISGERISDHSQFPVDVRALDRGIYYMLIDDQQVSTFVKL